MVADVGFDNPVVGDHEYVELPGELIPNEAVVALAHTGLGVVALTFGNGLTVTFTDAVLEQPFPSVTLTVYKVVAVGVAIVVAVVGVVNPVVGDQLYFVPPVAFKFAEALAHIV